MVSCRQRKNARWRLRPTSVLRTRSGTGESGGMGSYSEQIVYAPSEDQRWLAGILMYPTAGAARSIGIVSLHGSPGYF